MKLIRQLTAAALAAAMLLAGCAGNTNDSKSTGDSASAGGVPMLWKVQGDKGNVMYLFGSIHAGDKRTDDVLESLRKNLSEDEFKAATNALSAIRAKLADKARSKIDFLRSIDVSHMSEADRKNHETFITLAEKREAAMAKMKGGIPDPATLQEVVLVGMQMTPVAKKERSALVREVARELGYAGDDVDVVHDAMLNIYDATAPEGLDAFVNAANDAATSPNGVDVKVKTGVTM